MTADSARLAVLKAIAVALRAMRGSDYHFPVTSDRSVTLDPTMNLLVSTGLDLPVYVIEPDPDGDREFFPAMQVREVMRGTITGRMDVRDASDPASRATAWEGMAADLERALAADVTLGGLVYDLRLMGPSPMVGVGSAVVILSQPFEARIHRAYGEP